jgi:hypothetical protein
MKPLSSLPVSKVHTEVEAPTDKEKRPELGLTF